MSIDPAGLAHDGIVPDEVRRLRLEPGETLIVRVRDGGFTALQIREYQRALREWFPNWPTRVVIGEEILVARIDQDASDA